MPEVVSAERATTLTEQPILPPVAITVGAEAVAFPRASPGLHPIELHRLDLEIPRFSLFHGEDVRLNGFRLLRAGDTFCTDASLVMPAEAEHFTRKLEAGQTENIDFPALQDDSAHQATELPDRPLLVAASDEPSNFGSWMYRILPKILMSLPHCEVAGILVYQQPWMTTLLASLDLGLDLVHHEPTRRYRIPRAVIPSLPAPQAYLRPEARDALLGLHDRLAGTRDLGPRIYVSRRGQAIARPGFRVLENETEIVERLATRGFREFIPEQHPFGEQIAILDRARIIVGCGGSNMFGCMFARHAELIVDLESCDEWLFAHRNVLSTTRTPFSMVRGVQVERGHLPHRNWTLDADTLLEGLDALGALGTPGTPA